MIIMCLVEDTGKNSVSPSTMAIIIASNHVIIVFFRNFIEMTREQFDALNSAMNVIIKKMCVDVLLGDIGIRPNKYKGRSNVEQILHIIKHHLKRLHANPFCLRIRALRKQKKENGCCKNHLVHSYIFADKGRTNRGIALSTNHGREIGRASCRERV